MLAGSGIRFITVFMLCGRIAAVGMLLIGMWSFLRSKDKFILYI